MHDMLAVILTDMKMIILFIGLFPFFSFQSKNVYNTVVFDSKAKDTATYNITANIKGLGNDTIMVGYNALSLDGGLIVYLDTIVAYNDRFTYKLPLGKPSLVNFVPKKSMVRKANGRSFRPITKQISVFLIPTTLVQITGTLHHDYLDYDIHGDQVNKQHIRLRESKKILEMDLVKQDLQMDALSATEGNQAFVTQLSDKKIQIQAEIQNLNLQFIKTHLESELSAYLLSSQPLDTVGKYYGMLSENATQGMFKEWLDYFWVNFKRSQAVNQTKTMVQVNDIAPDFSLQTIEGKEFLLSKTKGKYIVLDFWGSWCIPCLAGLPKMKELYEKYRTKL